jgi:hypothetical protein
MSTIEMQQPSYDELKNITLQVREEKRQKHLERIKIGRDEAIKHITEGCFDKMTNAANNGLDKTDIYSFTWVKDPNETHDENGNKTIFEGHVRLLDLITKSNRDFISSLNNFFNKEGETKYHCGFYKKKDNETGIYSWNIFVSWSLRKPKFHDSLNDGDENQEPVKRSHYSGRGRGRDGRGGRGGRGGRSNQYQKNI